LRKDIPAFHYMIGIAGGTTLRCATYAEYGTQGLSDAMLKAMKDRQACLLANHGQIAFGDDLENALWRAGEVETLCHQYWAALQAGKPVILSDKLMTTVLARFKTYGKQPGQLKKGDALSVVGPVRRDVKAPKASAARKKGK
jgi:L-fuculose-phosphate aldolase